MSITQTVEVPSSHRLTIDVPREIPAGPVILTFTPKTDAPQSGERGGFGCAKGEFWVADDFDVPVDMPIGKAQVSLTPLSETPGTHISLLSLRGSCKGLDTMEAYFERK